MLLDYGIIVVTIVSMKKAYLIVILLSISNIGFNQNIGIGGSALYNIQSESFGAGARVSIFPNNNLSFVPQFSYYFVGPVTEFTVGLSLELKVIKFNTINFPWTAAR